LRLITWNINSVRLRIGLVRRLLEEEQPDVLCLQETKTPDELFPRADFEALGYCHMLVHGMKGYNGVATLSVPALDPNLNCSYSYWKVGQYHSFSGYEKARQPFPNGRIHFGGEHCSQDFQGFLEGGASEGARAAGEILSDYKAGIFP